MDRIRPIASNPKVGETRGKIYKHLIERYHNALSNGYILEAITLMESIISDRLTSYIVSKNRKSGKRCSNFSTIGNCLSKLKLDQDFPHELRHEIEIWKESRNKAIHEMAKFEEGEYPEFEKKYQSFSLTATDGEKIFRKVDKFVRSYQKKLLVL